MCMYRVQSTWRYDVTLRGLRWFDDRPSIYGCLRGGSDHGRKLNVSEPVGAGIAGRGFPVGKLAIGPVPSTLNSD